MPHHVSLLADKSFLQSLSPQESNWLYHTFQVIIPPVLFYEALGDASKTKGATGKSGLDDLQSLISKADSASLVYHEHWQHIAQQELCGGIVDFIGRPFPEGMVISKNDLGESVAYFDQTDLQAVLDRWRSGNLTATELAFSHGWRPYAKSFPLENWFKEARKRKVPLDLTIDEVSYHSLRLASSDQRRHASFVDSARFCRLPEHDFVRAIKLWKKTGRRRLEDRYLYNFHLRYAHAVLRLGVASGNITTRSSNVIDFEYLYYLPFSQAFVSNDKLHVDFAPYVWPDTLFVDGKSLKRALRDLSVFYNSLSNEERGRGTYFYADFPPTQLDNEITRIFDKVLPEWRSRRARGSGSGREMSEKESRKLFADMEIARKAHSKQIREGRNPILPIDE